MKDQPYLPGLPTATSIGGQHRASQTVLPPEPPPDAYGVLFDEGDVRQALKVWDVSSGARLNELEPGQYEARRLAAMSEVMMFALRVAAINLEVR